MENIDPSHRNGQRPLSAAELAALGLIEVELPALTRRQQRALHRHARAHYGRHCREVRVSRFDVRGTDRTVLVAHLGPKPSAQVILTALRELLQDLPAGGAA